MAGFSNQITDSQLVCHLIAWNAIILPISKFTFAWRNNDEKKRHLENKTNRTRITYRFTKSAKTFSIEFARLFDSTIDTRTRACEIFHSPIGISLANWLMFASNRNTSSFVRWFIVFSYFSLDANVCAIFLSFFIILSYEVWKSQSRLDDVWNFWHWSVRTYDFIRNETKINFQLMNQTNKFKNVKKTNWILHSISTDDLTNHVDSHSKTIC